MSTDPYPIPDWADLRLAAEAVRNAYAAARYRPQVLAGVRYRQVSPDFEDTYPHRPPNADETFDFDADARRQVAVALEILISDLRPFADMYADRMEFYRTYLGLMELLEYSLPTSPLGPIRLSDGYDHHYFAFEVIHCWAFAVETWAREYISVLESLPLDRAAIERLNAEFPVGEADASAIHNRLRQEQSQVLKDLPKFADQQVIQVPSEHCDATKRDGDIGDGKPPRPPQCHLSKMNRRFVDAFWSEVDWGRHLPEVHCDLICRAIWPEESLVDVESMKGNRLGPQMSRLNSALLEGNESYQFSRRGDYVVLDVLKGPS
jgi:hypothetical protein